MEAVSHDVEDVSEHTHVVARVELVADSGVFVDVGKYLFEQVQAEVGVGAELVPQRPDHAVQDGVEVVLLQGEQRPEVELDERLQKAEEVGAYFGEGVEVGGDQRQGGGEDHLHQFVEEVQGQHLVELL